MIIGTVLFFVLIFVCAIYIFSSKDKENFYSVIFLS